MLLRNDNETYGLIARTLHWGVALFVPGLFALGLYMTSLTYYDPLYRTLPALHKSAGVVVIALVAMRIAWRFLNRPPAPLAHHSPYNGMPRF